MPLTTSAPIVDNRRHLRLIWVLFFLQFAGVGVYISFLNVYYHEVGLTGTEIGMLGMTSALSSMVGATAWGYISDRTGQSRLLLAAGMLGSAAVAQLIPLARAFPVFLLLSAVYSLFNSACFTLVDSTALALLGDQREEYGRYRLGGSFGYILSTATSGYLFDQLGLAALFPVYGVLGLLFAGAALFLPKQAVQRKTQEKGSFLQMIHQPVWLTLVACIFLIWLASSGAFGFLNITIKNMGGSDALIGLTGTASAIIEIPVMAYSGALLRRFGASRLFWLATFGYLLRFIFYSQMMSPEWALVINGLSGPIYVFFWNSAINIANRMAPPGLASTAQGLLVSTTSLAGVVSAPLCGYLFDRFGPSGMFTILAGFCLCAFLLYSFRQLAGTQ